MANINNKKLTRQLATGQKLIGHNLLQLPPLPPEACMDEEELDDHVGCWIVRDCHVYEGTTFIVFDNGIDLEFDWLQSFIIGYLKEMKTPGTDAHKHEEFFAPLRYIYKMGYCDHNGESQEVCP